MADIKFICPHCTQSIEAPEDMRGQILDCPNCRNPIQVHESTSPYPYPPGESPAAELQTNAKQGALIGAATCFVIGIGFMLWSLLTFPIYGPLFIAAFVLSIVAMVQKRILCGLLMLLATSIIPPMFGVFLAAMRADETEIALKQAMEQASADYERQAIQEFQRMLQPGTVANSGKTRGGRGLLVTEARYFREPTFFAYPHIQFSIQNQTGTAISRIFCRGRLSSPGRTIPWADQEFNVALPGGLEPGETKQINLQPPKDGPYGHAELKDRTDLVMEISIVNAEDASGKRLAR